MKPLTHYMERQQITQAAMAEKLGVSPSTISLWLAAKRLPSASLTKRIEAVTGIPRIDLRPDIFGDAQ